MLPHLNATLRAGTRTQAVGRITGKLGGRQLRLIPLKNAMNSYNKAEVTFQEQANGAAKKASARWERMRSTTEHAYVDQVSAVRQHGDRIRTTAEEKVAEQMEVDTTAAGDLIDKAEAELDVRLGEARARTETLVGRFIPLVHGSRIRRLSRLQDQARVWRQQSDALIRHGDTISLSALCDLLLAIDPKDPEVESRARVLVALRASVFEQLGDAATGLTERLIELRTTAVAALRAHWEDVQTKFEQDLKPALDELRPAHEHLCDELRKAGREPLPPLPAT